jgi:transcriptional antiterminator RfaH
VVYTAPQAEGVAAENLQAQGFTTYLPLIRERRINRHVRVVPLFPRYLFTSFDPETDAWGAIFFTRGVVRLLRRDLYTPAEVPADLVQELMQRAAQYPDGVIDDAPGADLKPLQPGEHVRVVSGPLEGMRGVCAHSTRRRVRLLLELLGGGRRLVELGREQVAA